VAGSCERGNKLMASVTGGEFLGYMTDYQLFKDCPPCS
jgi:hypothetical protein